MSQTTFVTNGGTNSSNIFAKVIYPRVFQITDWTGLKGVWKWWDKAKITTWEKVLCAQFNISSVSIKCWPRHKHSKQKRDSSQSTFSVWFKSWDFNGRIARQILSRPLHSCHNRGLQTQHRLDQDTLIFPSGVYSGILKAFFVRIHSSKQVLLKICPTETSWEAYFIRSYAWIHELLFYHDKPGWSCFLTKGGLARWVRDVLISFQKITGDWVSVWRTMVISL